MNIINQWKTYLRFIHYNIFIKKNLKNIEKIIKEEENKIIKYSSKVEKIQKVKKELIAKIENIQNKNDNKNIYLIGNEFKKDN